MEIEPRLKSTILGALGLDDWDITGDTLAYEVPGWDSLSHVSVIAAVEREYGLRFKASEVTALRDIGDLDALVRKKSSSSSPP
jgi:acyl carrier protein